MFGIDGVLLALIITFIILFGAILSGFPVAFAIGGADQRFAVPGIGVR